MAGRFVRFLAVGVVAAQALLVAGPAGAATTEENAKYVGALYGTLLGRGPDEAGQQYWVQALDGGAARLAVVNGIAGGAEFRRAVVRFLYGQVLNRPPDQGGLAYWSDRLHEGLRIEDLEVGLLATSEYYRHSGGSPGGFVDAAFRHLLGRDAEPSAHGYWVGRLEAGESRASVAAALQRSPEGRRSFAHFAYPFVLGRDPSAADVAAVVDQLAGGAGYREVLFGLAASDEYFANAQLPPPQVVAGYPAWSPDGESIAFVSDRSGNFEVYVANSDGTNVRPLTAAPGFDGEMSWSPDSSRLAFTSEQGGQPDIWVMDADGSGQTQLTTDEHFDVEAAWSPDGAKIAFWSDRDGNPEIYVMDADGAHQQRLTDDPAQDFAPAWTPDGRIVFSSDRDGDPELFVMDGDGSNVTQLTHNDDYDSKAAVSPDGSLVAYASDTTGTPSIMVMAIDGTGAHTVVSDPGGPWGPTWSPDGSQIAYEQGTPRDIHVFVVDADGTGAHQLI